MRIGRGTSATPLIDLEVMKSLFTDILEEARFSRTQHGNAMLVDSQNFCYMVNRKKERRIYWNCHQRNHKCKGTAITEGFYIIRKGGEHNHDAYPPPRNRYTES